MTCMDVIKKKYCEEFFFLISYEPCYIYPDSGSEVSLCYLADNTHTDVLLSTCTSDIKYSYSVYLVSSIISFQNNAAQWLSLCKCIQ